MLHVAYIEEANNICCGRWQHVRQFLYDISQQDIFYKKKMLEKTAQVEGSKFWTSPHSIQY
jgi:hypothetical protein